MNVQLEDLENRLNEAEESVKRMTRLMLRAVWQCVTQHQSSPAVTNGGPSVTRATAGGTSYVVVPLSPHRHRGHDGELQPQKRGGLAAAAAAKPMKGTGGRGGGRVVDQARLSRELYRKAFDAARQRVETGEMVRKGTEEDEEEGGGGEAVHSVALLLLQSSRKRAIMSIFLIRLRLSAQRRRLLYEECELRYSYYRLRRVLRGWHNFAHETNCGRQRLLCTVLQHWMNIVGRRKGMRDCLRCFRVGLKKRGFAFEIVRRRQLKRHFLHWRRRLDICRIVDSMEERTTEMRRRHKYVDLYWSEQPTTPLFSIKDRVFSHWKKKTEHRLDARLAELMSKRFLMRYTWNKLLHLYLSARRSYGDFSPPLESGIPRVNVESQSVEFIVFKVQCAQQVAHGRLRKSAFLKWREKCANRLADRFFVFHRCVQVMEAWLQALRRKRVKSFVIAACWLRWRQRLCLRLQSIQAQCWRRQRLQRDALLLWHNKTLVGRFSRQRALQSCLSRWWEHARLRWARRRLIEGRKRRVLACWRDLVRRERNQRAMSCVAETLRELVLLVGCFRRWRERHEHTCRVRLSESILSDLRREKQRARLFQRWKRLTFWPRAVVCKSPAPSS